MKRAAGLLQRFEEAVLSGGVLGIAALTIANVIGRALFSHSLAFAEEISQFLIVLVTFVGLGYAAGKARHIRMTAIYDQLPDAWRKRIIVVINATTCAMLVYLTYLSISYAVGTVRALGSVSPTLRVPLWTVYLSAPLGFGLAAVQYALALAKNLTSEGVWLSATKEDVYDPEEAPPEGI